MARPLRMERIGRWYHITARGNERKDIFRDDRDREHFLELLEEAVDLFALRLHAYVLMPNHHHLLVEITETNLSRAMHWLGVSYTVWFNRRHGRIGHLFQGRFKSVVVEPEGWALEVSRYIHLNPVRLDALGLGKQQRQRGRAVGTEQVDPRQVSVRIQKLRQYRWSSFRAYAGLTRRPEWLTIQTVLKLAGKAANSQERYRRHCENAAREGLEESPWENLIGQVVLGSQRFAAQVASSLDKREKGRRKLGGRPGPEQIIAVVERLRGEKWEQFRDRHGDTGRDLVLHLGRTLSGASIRELSTLAQIEYVSTATALRRFSARAVKDRSVGRLIEEATRQLHNE